MAEKDYPGTANNDLPMGGTGKATPDNDPKRTQATNDGLAKMGDILTASKGAMEPYDYSHGYPPNDVELLNQNFAQRSTKKNRGA